MGGDICCPIIGTPLLRWSRFLQAAQVAPTCERMHNASNHECTKCQVRSLWSITHSLHSGEPFSARSFFVCEPLRIPANIFQRNGRYFSFMHSRKCIVFS